MASAEKSYKDVSAAYASHRTLIDDIVKRTNDGNAETETDAVNRVKRFTLILWVVSGLAFFIVGAGIIGVAIGVIHPIAKMTRVMKRLADGEMNDDARF